MTAFLRLFGFGSGDPNPIPKPAPVPVPPPPVPAPIPIEADFPPFELPKSNSMASDRTSHLSITGPLHPVYTDHPTAEWRFMDTANTSSTRMFLFSGNPPTYKWVQWQMIWKPTNVNQKVRLVYAHSDAVPPVKDWPEIVVIQGAANTNGWGIRPDPVDVTVFFNQAAIAKRDMYIGWQVYGDGAPMDVCESRLTFWELD